MHNPTCNTCTEARSSRYEAVSAGNSPFSLYCPHHETPEDTRTCVNRNHAHGKRAVPTIPDCFADYTDPDSGNVYLEP